MTIEKPTRLVRELLAANGYLCLRELPGLDSLYVDEGFLEEYSRNLLEFHEKRHVAIRWR